MAMITVVGSLNMDLVINAPNIPKPGETILGRNFKQIPGGKGANQADAAARLGGKVYMLGVVGQDAMGKILKQSLEEDGVNVEHILEKDYLATGVAAIIVDDQGNNAITVAPGANFELTSEDITKFQQVILSSDLLLLQLEVPLDTVKTALKLAKSAQKMTILNPAPAVELDREILSHTDILTPNETELEQLSGEKTDTLENIQLAGKSLLDKGAKDIVVTLGEKGCMHIHKGGVKHYPAYKVKAVDTTAAGDSFNGALAVSLSQGKSMEEAIAFAMKIGAMTVTKEGAQTSLPWAKEIDLFEDWLKQ